MKKNIKQMLAGALLLPLMVFGASFALAPSTAFAADDLSLSGGAKAAQGKDQQGDAQCLFGTESNCSGGGIFKTITNVLLFLIGAISVIMLIVGGIRYVVSGGDSSAVQAAKNTILYAIVGVVVAILSYAVVNFVISQFSGSNT